MDLQDINKRHRLLLDAAGNNLDIVEKALMKATKRAGDEVPTFKNVLHEIKQINATKPGERADKTPSKTNSESPEGEIKVQESYTRNVEIKILDERVREWAKGLPKYQSHMAAAIDLYACIDHPIIIKPGETVLIPSGISVFLGKEDMVALIYPRSSMGHKKGLVLGNSTGVVDADYSGPVLVSAFNRNPKHLRWWKNSNVEIKPGERIAQMVFAPIFRANLQEVENFSTVTDRGNGGFGSTGS